VFGSEGLFSDGQQRGELVAGPGLISCFTRRPGEALAGGEGVGVVGDWGVMNSQEKDERCRDGCLALRMARVADRLLQEENPDSWWNVQFWAISSPSDEIKLTPAGEYPHGTVPVEFQIKWWLAVSDAALEMVRYLKQGIA
jgi:hypothetical protein